MARQGTKPDVLDLVEFCKRGIWEWQASTEMAGVGQLIGVNEHAHFPPLCSPYPPRHGGFPIRKDLGHCTCSSPSKTVDLKFPDTVREKVKKNGTRVLQLTTADVIDVDFDKKDLPLSDSVPAIVVASTSRGGTGTGTPTRAMQEELKDLKFDWTKAELHAVEADVKREITGIRKYGKLPLWMTGNDCYNTFTDETNKDITEINFPLRNDVELFLENFTMNWTMQRKAELYWLHKLSHSQGKVISAIMAAVPSLEKLGYRQWLLPNGRKVPLDSLAIIEFGIVPKAFTLVKIEVIGIKLRMNIPGEKDRCKNIRVVSEEHSRYWNIYAKDFDEERGVFNFRHYALTTTVDMDEKVGLQVSKFYVVDPTVRQWGGFGPVVLCGEMDDYVSRFPGEITSVDLLTMEQMKQFQQRSMVPLLTYNIVRWFKSPICNYCGEVEKYEPPPQEFVGTNNFTFTFSNCTLMNCARCNKVRYCGKFCQLMDWREHKATCEKKNA